MNNELIERIDRLYELEAVQIIKQLFEPVLTVECSVAKEMLLIISDCKAALTQQQEDCEELQSKYHLLASEMVYEGNSVQHWRQKAIAYKECAGVIYELKSLLGVKTPADVLEQVKPQQQEAEPVACAACEPWGFSESNDAMRRKHCKDCGGTGALYRHPQEAQPQVPDGWDEGAYKSACDGLEYWKQRASDSEQALERIRNDLSPAHMGEPAIEKDREEFLSWISYLEAGKQINYEISAKIALCMRGCLKHFRTCFSGQRFTGLREKAEQEIEFLRLAADQYEGVEDYALAADQIRLVSLIRDLLSAAKEES